jgi:hypothetical protein
MPIDNKSQQSSPFEIITNKKTQKMSPKNLGVIMMLLVFLAASIFLGVYLVQKRTNVAQKAAPSTAIYISPSSQSKAPGSNFSFNVVMDTSTNFVTGVDVRLKFDPNIIQVTSLQPGSGVTNLNQTITNVYDNTAGTATYAIFTIDSSKAVNGSGVQVLTVNASVKSTAAAGSYNITFDPATAASASQEGQNVLVSKAQGTLVVSAASATQAPTQAPTNAPTQAPTATPVRTATPGATSSATRTPTATPTQIAQATSTAAPTNAPTQAPTNAPTQAPTNAPTNAPTASPAPTQSTPLPIPQTGTDWPTFLGLAFGLLIIAASIAIAL